MPAFDDSLTLGELWARTVDRYGDRPFLAVPRNPARDYHPDGYELTYAQAAAQVDSIAAAWRESGYGAGHRVATLLENRPEALLHKLALNSLGVCVVPINPDYRAAEVAYLAGHSRPDAVLVLDSRRAALEAALARSPHRPAIATLETFPVGLAPAARASAGGIPTTATPASILYTSGTTGAPKGCVLSHGYEVASGTWYATMGGRLAFDPAGERIYNPLPLYHVNAGVMSIVGAIRGGHCQVQADRFHPQRWWPEIRETRATIVHYLGVVVSMLLAQPASAADRDHGARAGIGAGVEPQGHAAFEERFALPLVEIWGMTEMVRLLGDTDEPRQVGSRAFGRAVPGIDVRIVDEADAPTPDGTPGEMVIRHSEATPRRGFFSGYLDDAKATEHAWRGGWFHTGDVVTRANDGMLHFVDRKKNIIRRSGENIAAAEVESVILAHPAIAQVAVVAVPDEVREEEVWACIVPREAGDARALAVAIQHHCLERLAYYKAPGWVHVVESLPTTGTQKIQKHTIYPKGTDPRTVPGAIDLRAGKRRAPGP